MRISASRPAVKEEQRSRLFCTNGLQSEFCSMNEKGQGYQRMVQLIHTTGPPPHWLVRGKLSSVQIAIGTQIANGLLENSGKCLLSIEHSVLFEMILRKVCVCLHTAFQPLSPSPSAVFCFSPSSRDISEAVVTHAE